MRLLAACLLALAAALPARAERLRVATFNTELSRDGPGLLLRDIERGGDAQIAAAVHVIADAQPDVLVLQGIDWDLENRALKALERRLALAGAPYPHLFARQPNTGLASGLDLNGDGRVGGPGDSQGYGNYTGRGGMAVLSRLPFAADGMRDLTPLLWRDLPEALLPVHADGRPFPSGEAQAVQRLSSKAHWVLPLALPGGGRLTLMAFQAAPPVFDGPEDRNGRRNHDEIRLWQVLLDGGLGPVPPAPFVIAGGANLDPDRGAGRREAIRGLLSDPRLQDPRPASARGGVSTVAWPRAGEMRVDYVLPSAGLQVLDARVAWPETLDSPAATASRHRLVWVDILVE